MIDDLCIRIYLASHVPSGFHTYLPPGDSSIFWVAYVPNVFKNTHISFLESTSFSRDAVSEVIEVPDGQLYLGRNPL
jgi:hypothetical protein